MYFRENYTNLNWWTFPSSHPTMLVKVGDLDFQICCCLLVKVPTLWTMSWLCYISDHIFLSFSKCPLQNNFMLLFTSQGSMDILSWKIFLPVSSSYCALSLVFLGLHVIWTHLWSFPLTLRDIDGRLTIGTICHPFVCQPHNWPLLYYCINYSWT